MSTNISKEKREKLLNQINEIKGFIEKSKQDENTKNLLSYISSLETEVKSKKYGLVFEEHKETIDEVLENNVPYLVEDENLFVDNGGQINFLLEGDNLASLKLLNKTHHNSIDIIYIDPPYNTGNKDFIYDDVFVDVNDTFKHSKWLSFMQKRLEIAKTLLSHKGIIFISIDDNEQAQLKILCDSIFGEENIYGECIQLKGNTQNDSKTIQKNHEYILCYSKKAQPLLLTYKNYVNKEVFEEEYYLGRDTGASSGHDRLIERANLGYTIYYIESTINGATGNHNRLIERANLGYTIYYIESTINGATGNHNRLIERANYFNSKYGNFNYYISKDGKKFIHAIAIADYDKTKVKENSTEEEIYTDIEELKENGYSIIRPPKRKGNKLGCWTWGIDAFINYWNNNEVLIKNYKNIVKKEFVTSADIVKVGNKYIFQKTNILPLKSIIEITNSAGTTMLKGNDGILPGCDFNNPKSVELLEYLIGAYCKKNITVLDFFAGSGTTGHAVMKLNAEDGGNRKFILCTNNENNICRDVTYQRLKNVIEKEYYKASLKYMKVEYLPITDKLYYEYADELLLHIKELVELENAVNFAENKEIAIILTDEELDSFTSNIPNECETIYLGHAVLPTDEQEQLFADKNIKVNIIPDYYYKDMEN